MSTGFLASFHYYRSKDMAEVAGLLHGFRLFADSGAFSAKSLGAEVRLDDYCQWVTRWQRLFHTYVTLDVIGSAEGTWRNHLEMERRGLRPTPVFHAGEPWEYLERYIDRGHGYIALGGMVGSPSAVKKWIIRCFRIAEGRAVFHGFGRTNLRDIADFPWYSVDSSSWGMAYRYGQVNLFDRGRWVKVSIGDRVGVYKNAALIRQHGVDPRYLANRSEYHWRHAARASAIAWHRLGQWAHRRHAPVTIPGRADDQPGPHQLLAEAAGGTIMQRLGTAAEAIREQQQADPGPHLYLADTAMGPNLRLPVAAQAIHDDGQEAAPPPIPEVGPHLYLADGAAAQLGLAAEAIRQAGA